MSDKWNQIKSPRRGSASLLYKPGRDPDHYRLDARQKNKVNRFMPVSQWQPGGNAQSRVSDFPVGIDASGAADSSSKPINGAR